MSGDLMTQPGQFPVLSRSEALEGLRRAAHSFSPFAETPAHRADLALIGEAIARLGAVTPQVSVEMRDFDPSRLAHLLELTGPDLAQELLTRLTEDLSGVLDVVGNDRVAGDWKSLREATHVLISLAGSVGALSLQAMAEALNAAAHRQDQDTAEVLLPPMAQELQALIDHVRATQAAGGRTA